MDLSLLKLLNGLAGHGDGFEDVLELIARQAYLVFVGLLAVLFLARGKFGSAESRRAVVSAGFASLIALGIAHVIAGAVDRARPYAAHPGDAHLYVPASHDPSFPSDHATAAFAIAMAIWLRNRAVGAFALALAALLSLSRVAVGVHYPSDVVVGALIGSAAALLLWMPVLRDRLDRFADFAGQFYERALERVPGVGRHTRPLG